MLLGGLARGSRPAGSVVVVGLGMSALPVVVVVISGGAWLAAATFLGLLVWLFRSAAG